MTFTKTQEQLDIIEFAKSGKDLIIQAYAGSSKTYTLKSIAEALPEKRILYIAFNKAIVDEGLRMISAPVSTGATALIETLRSLDDAGIHPLDVSLKRPSLDDVFLSLTGHAAEEKKEEDAEVGGRRKKAKK